MLAIPRQRWLALLISLLLVALLTALIIVLQNASLVKKDEVVVRQVEVAAPPPPPPPPPASQRVQVKSLSLELGASGDGAAIAVGELSLDDGIDLAKIEPPPVNDSAAQYLQDSLQMAWDDLFAMADLDERPRLLTSLAIRFPKALQRRGVKTVVAEVEVIINSDGKVVLKSIRHSSHPEINTVITQLMARARFTAPRKDGVAVRASFNWPLEFNDT